VHDRADDRHRVAALEQLEPSGIEAAGRRRVEHDTSADSRLRPQHDVIASLGDDRFAQPQLGVAAFAHDPCSDVTRADVDGHRRRHRLELLQRNIEPPADRIGARLDEHVAAPQLRPRDSGQVDRDPLPGLGPLDRDVVHLDAARPRAQAGGLDAQLVAGCDRAGAQRAGDDGARARNREGTIDVEPGLRLARARRHLRGGASQRLPQLVETGAGLRADRDDLGTRNELASLGVHGVRLGHSDDAALDPEQPQDREVLMSLRPRPLAGVDH
jgi:hypothetical protein